jgi:hypothetical protein
MSENVGARRTRKLDNDLSLNFVTAHGVLGLKLFAHLGELKLFGSQGLVVCVRGNGSRGKKVGAGKKGPRGERNSK